MMGDLEGIIIFIPVLYLAMYLAAYLVTRKLKP